MTLTTPPNLPPRLLHRIEAVQKEDDAYAADELVELGEEILSQLAALGIAVYLQQGKQKEVFNDFLISLFLSNGHAYNAGPLYRWAANMIKEAESTDAELLKPFFWQEKDGKKVLNEAIHHLASLRNAVMHGFFVLPPERNREETQKMTAILEQMNKAGLFEKQFGTFHFVDSNGFNGHWNIIDSKAWTNFSECFSFGELAQRVSHEYSENFRLEERAFATEKTTSHADVQQATYELLEKGKGALVCWYSPGSKGGKEAYRSMVQSVSNETYLPIYYALHERGATFTTAFFTKELGNALFELTQKENARKEPIKFLKNRDNSKFVTKKPVLILHDIHVALFNDNHLTLFFNELFDAGIPVLCTAWPYPYLRRFFNQEVYVDEQPKQITIEIIEYSLNNYLRFKGPSKEQNDQVAEYQKVKDIVFAIHQQLENGESLVARRFADQYTYPIEFVHEAFSILSPFYRLDKEKFKEDEVDELYGFPKTIEESSRIFLTLGRRDVKLEYQHRVLSK
ncbi:MAG: hypothetical protein FJZ66_00155 [Bacteroidetes bacterium]|nr:hypothetical protein [Bacteroidota bacterium]